MSELYVGRTAVIAILAVHDWANGSGGNAVVAAAHREMRGGLNDREVGGRKRERVAGNRTRHASEAGNQDKRCDDPQCKFSIRQFSHQMSSPVAYSHLPF